MSDEPIRYLDSNGRPEYVSVEAPLPVNIGSATLSVTADGVEIKNDSGNPIPTGVGTRTPATTSVASSATSVTILAANASRKGFSISNISTAKLYLSFTSPATTTNCFIEVPAGAFLLLDQQLIVGSAIYGIWASANGTAQVTEFV
jgi:hypothetical protein